MVRLVLLLGSGSSVPAGMPKVADITDRVLAGNNVMRTGSGYRVVDRLPPNYEFFMQDFPEIIGFVGELKRLCDDYFASQEKDRTTNYEDIAYVAGQIEDGLRSEYENPALLPLNDRLGLAAGRTLEDLLRLATESVDYIDDVVRSLLAGPIGGVDGLAAITDGLADPGIDVITAATLNQDLVLERALREAGTSYSDGFGDAFGTLRIWNDEFSVPNRKLLKLHGSVDWWRYTLTRDGWTGQFTARAIDGDPEHARGPEGELLDYPALGRPLILTGTFNKILSYPSGIYADQHVRFHAALVAADVLVVVGYGFRDKAINARLVAWAERPGLRRMVVVHADPARLGAGARGAIRDKWARWQESGLLKFVPQHLSATTTWNSIRGMMD
jgi:SIR2-like domain